jgi:hypothetical protein
MDHICPEVRPNFQRRFAANGQVPAGDDAGVACTARSMLDHGRPEGCRGDAGAGTDKE